MTNRALATILSSSVVVMLSHAAPALAQGAGTTPTAAQPNLRFFQQFIADAEIVEKQWYSVELRLQRGAVPPIEHADGFLLTPLIAVSPLENLEVGGKVSYIDYDLDNEVGGFNGESGLGDLTVWGKYRFLSGDVSLSAGGSLDLPTGSEDDGLGTGKIVPVVFGAIRANAGVGQVMGEVGLRFNRDATLLDARFKGRTSTFLGGGYIWEPVDDLAVSGEVTVESERFDGGESEPLSPGGSRVPAGSSDFRATAGVQWLGVPHSAFRGAFSLGLTDGAPDFELILGYAYHF